MSPSQSSLDVQSFGVQRGNSKEQTLLLPDLSVAADKLDDCNVALINLFRSPLSEKSLDAIDKMVVELQTPR